MPDEAEHGNPIGWARAIVISVLVVVVGIAVLVYGANTLLTHVHRITRSGLVAIVTPSFFLFVLLMAAVLRRLQRRKVI